MQKSLDFGPESIHGYLHKKWQNLYIKGAKSEMQGKEYKEEPKILSSSIFGG
jgi:hypothetical protein